LIEIAKIKHNDILAYLRTSKENKLQKEFLSFLAKMQESEPAEYYMERRQVKELGRVGKGG
jgi:hypothetical protein